MDDGFLLDLLEHIYNMYSVYRNGLDGDVMANVPTPGILSPTECRPFWISWSDTTEVGKSVVKVGRGYDIKQQAFLVKKFTKFTMPHPLTKIKLRTFRADWSVWKFFYDA